MIFLLNCAVLWTMHEFPTMFDAWFEARMKELDELSVAEMERDQDSADSLGVLFLMAITITTSLSTSP